MVVPSDLSAATCAVASAVSFYQAARSGKRSLTVVAVALAALAGWALVVCLYLRLPFSPQRVHALLAALCLAPGPWLAAALALHERSLEIVWTRWRGCLVVQALASGAAAVLMLSLGVDWITGIGPEPAVILSRWGLVAVAVGALPTGAAVALLAGGLPAGVATTPALLVGTLGAATSLLWAAASVLWRGYVAPTALLSATAVGTVAAVLSAIGAVREAPSGGSLIPSRRLVYGATIACLLAFYVLAAHVALGWATELAHNAGPEIVPAFSFAVIAALVVVGGSRRWRHHIWVAIGQHVFRSKHDYGEVWIRLTELVSAAHTVPDLVQRAATLCRNALGGPDVSIWLTDAGGELRRAATTAATPPETGKGNGDPREQLVPPEPHSANGSARSKSNNEAHLAGHTRSSFACALRLNGRVLGALAIGTPERPVLLDDEDRRLVRYIAAQVASALGLFRLGEEVADAREVGSFHRLSAFVVHDLKNLVAQQSLVLENAAKFRNDPAFVHDALAAFEDSTIRMRSLIGRLRSRESATPSNPTPCDLLEVIRDLIAEQRVALRHGSSVELITPVGVRQCLVRFDRPAAAQLFCNLLVNAIESLPIEGGEITVAIRADGGVWQVDVQDTGIGIPAAFLREQVFRPFHTTKDQGLGIGLFQCKSIVDAAGGTIRVSSTPGTGTLVAVTLPALTLTEPAEAGIVETQHG
jgi:putative PEP-CTERM system histidine kinase